MNTVELEKLNEQFLLQDELYSLCIESGEGDIPVIKVMNEHASALISLQGAHVLSWIPKGEQEVIWLSEDATFAAGKSIRGGIPVCWPWFGAHESKTEFPAHGFARTTSWEVLSTEALENGGTRIIFSMHRQPENDHMWLPDTSIQFNLTIGYKLELELITHNNGDSAVTIGQALHTYFNVADVSEVFLHGLDHTDYLDKLENFKRKRQFGPIVIEQEVDRVYLDTFNDCVIEDKQLKRNIIIKKIGSHSTVVWNPWQETAEKMGDLGLQGYKKMLCVESSNAAEDVVTIEPGDVHELWVQYEVQKTN
ncbi:MAG: D-hexose-6-phosphate mutarotase [Gammaproteobacteria bacterium]|jgi:D-hexose-6-phosphate mutarotase|nr:D-hexose-6-phosphate mutarotase [Gammaproteobacteria bacterium]MBT3722949.1 D-hexose-6-phosphate mutarotase [Gammaproteobacteria bacterium]MBT4077418.1 D-hexose-6-phosphate mutarotase [Gammaproteobacteria bacterium]MBT4193393.1 D-hexose-6-phosphate mutarotase [Gammaproteobacteria bacterium]MBT4449066.1 D-hexose-6-phosphate mutarotase [Gammaproteobacteria bacterium]